jgi:hypothetical protein
MNKKEKIIELTNSFFEMHWYSKNEHSSPEWKFGYSWSGSVPYHDKGGVYALLGANDEVIYIGLGASRGGGIYKEHGLSRRLLNHVLDVNKEKGSGHYLPKKKWSTIKDIGAIGFPEELTYLAAALEDYLIGLLNPPENVTKRKCT